MLSERQDDDGSQQRTYCRSAIAANLKDRLCQTLLASRCHLCVINVQQDKQKPQYTLTYVDLYLGMGNVEDYLNPQTQPNAQEGFTVINDADDLPF